MERSKKYKPTRVNRDWTKSRKVNAPKILKDLMVKKLQSSLEDGDMCRLSMHTDPSNEDSTRVKRKICILDHTKNLI